ncbi:MAG: beta strand repeat-containing protein, partial [Pirellulales bacterium]
MKLWPFTRSGVKTFNEARKQWRWCSIGRSRHHSRRSIPGGSHADVSLMHEPLEVRKLLAISAGYDGNDLAITADAEGDAITLEFNGNEFKIYDGSNLYDTYTTSGFSGNITASSTDANLNTSFTFAFDQTALPRALQIDASISSTAIGSAIESTSSADISFGGLTTIAADISTPASINFGGDVVIFDDITLTATDVIVSGNVEAAVSAFGMDNIGITWQETTAATTSSTAMVTPAGESPEVWAAAVGYGGGIERFNPADGSSLGSLGYDVTTSGHGNFNLIPCPTGEYVYGVHYTPYTSGGGGYANPGTVYQYATDGSGYATFYLGQYEYDYRGYQCLTIADDGSYILLSQGEKIFKIDTASAWASDSTNQDRIQHEWELPDSKNYNDYRYNEQLRVNSIAILPDGSRAYAAMNYNNAPTAADIAGGKMNAFAVLNLQTLGQPVITSLQGAGNNNGQPNYVAAAPDSSAIYVANRRGGSSMVWRVGVPSGTQKDLWQGGSSYTNAVLSGDGSRFFTTKGGSSRTDFEVYDTTNGSISKINYRYYSIDGNAQIPNTNSHGYNQPSLVVSNDGSYGAVATTNNEVVILDWSKTDSPIQVDRVQVDHTISSIKLVETDTSSAIYVGGSNKVTKIFIAGDAEDGKPPVLPETSTLVVNASNLSHFGGSIGATNPLTGLVTDAPGATVLSGNVTTTGDHTFLDPVQLQADVALLGTGFSALEAGATGSFHLNAFANSGTRIEGVSNLSSLSTNTTITVNGTINTTGQQQYDDGIQLLGDTTLGGGSAILAGTIEGNNQNLTLDFSAETAINNPGDSNRIANFVSNGPIALQGTISTTGSQTYASTLTLADDATIVAQSTNLTGGIAGNQKNLMLNVQNETLIDGTSVFDNLASIESVGPVSLNATVVTSGNQNYSGTVTLVGDTTLVADAGEFSREIIGNGQDLTLNINNTITIEDGSGVKNLTSIGETILTGTINTTGSQTYQSNVTIEGDVTINAGGEVVFEGDVTGNDTFTSTTWAAQAGGERDINAAGVSVLEDGSSIVTGYFKGTATFGKTTLTSDSGFDDIFVAKLDADGEYEWVTQAGTEQGGFGKGVSVLEDGSSIVVGYFKGTATFGNTTLTSDGGFDVFVAKLDANGVYQWATRAGGTEYCWAWAISVLEDGSSIVTGHFKGTAAFGETTLISDGSDDVFVAKLDANGVYQWATRAPGNSYASGSGVVSVLTDGSSIVTGAFQGSATFGNTTLVSGGYGDVFVAKLNANGEYQWAAQGVGPKYNMAESVSVLADGSSIVVTGYFTDTVTFGNTTLTSAGESERDVFIAKLNANGEYQWARRAGAPESTDNGHSVSVLADGSSIVAGVFALNATFGNTTLTSYGDFDVFVAKLDADGEYEWVTQAGGTRADSGYGVSVLEDGSSIVTGYFFGDATFGSTTLTSAGSKDVFIAKLDADGSFAGAVIPDDADLTINTQADTTFGGTVSDLATLTTDNGGSTIAKADITTTGNQTYNDQFVLNTSLTLTGGNASFTGGIDGDGNDLTLNFTGNATLDGGS